jgi:hypothetical protein
MIIASLGCECCSLAYVRRRSACDTIRYAVTFQVADLQNITPVASEIGSNIESRVLADGLQELRS